MSKRELIDAILRYNRTAAPEFLARFTEPDLKAYLDRVTSVIVMKDSSSPSSRVLSNQQAA